MKKLLCLLLVAVTLISLFACGTFVDNEPSSSQAGNDSVDDSAFDESLEISSYIEPSSEDSSDISSTVDSSEFSEESSSDSINASADGPSEDVVDGTRFSRISPDVAFNNVWKSGEMELFNTDFRMSDSLYNKFEQCFSSFSNNESVALIELDTNMAFTFSKDTKIATASSIKAPLALFVSKCIDDGIISWNTQKKYEWWHFQENSTGVVQNSPYGTAFTVETLMDYMVRISDNQAYLMLKELVGVEEFEKMMSSLGSSRIIPVGSNWGSITAWEMASAWREIYYYSKFNSSGEQLFDRFMHAMYNYIWRAIPQYEAAHKSGWSGRAFNDAGVVFAGNRQYVLVVLVGRNGLKDTSSQYQFNAVTRLLAELMVEYNNYLDSANAN